LPARLSLAHSNNSNKPGCGFAAVGPADRRYRSIAARRSVANAGSATFSAAAEG